MIIEGAMTYPQTQPVIVSSAADAHFRREASRFGFDPDSRWVGGYVDFEWRHARFFLEAFLSVRGSRILEFGCNVGASAIVAAHLGAAVTGIDADARFLELAAANAKRYGKSEIALCLVKPGSALPFLDESFDAIICNSVLEYVSPSLLTPALRELDRVLKPGGRLLVLGTSNRLFPVEVHSRGWFSNFVPRAVDRIFGWRQRGIFPWQVTVNLCGYRDVVAEDDGDRYVRVRHAMGDGSLKIVVIRVVGLLARPFGLSLSAVTPSFCLVLEKPHADARS